MQLLLPRENELDPTAVSSSLISTLRERGRKRDRKRKEARQEEKDDDPTAATAPPSTRTQERRKERKRAAPVVFEENKDHVELRRWGWLLTYLQLTEKKGRVRKRN